MHQHVQCARFPFFFEKKEEIEFTNIKETEIKTLKKKWLQSLSHNFLILKNEQNWNNFLIQEQGSQHRILIKSVQCGLQK